MGGKSDRIYIKYKLAKDYLVLKLVSNARGKIANSSKSDPFAIQRLKAAFSVLGKISKFNI